MPRPMQYCNKKKKHKSVYRNLKLKENWNDVFSNMIGKYICDSHRLLFTLCNLSQPVKSVEILQPKNEQKEYSLRSESSSDDIYCKKIS